MNKEEKLIKAYQSLAKLVQFEPKVALVLGSGLGHFAETIESIYSIPYEAVAGMPTSTVEGHSGRFVFGYAAGLPVVIMQGRVHLYEGYSPDDVVMPIRLMRMTGADTLILTNAAGGITYTEVGSYMAITDHINFAASPLRGKNISFLGPRFPDMSMPYDIDLLNLASECAVKLNFKLEKGVYMQFTGPSFETAAEVRMAKVMGADAVGMSTAVECIAARHMGMRVAGFSCITNPACGIGSAKLSHVDVQAAAAANAKQFEELLSAVLDGLKREAERPRDGEAKEVKPRKKPRNAFEIEPPPQHRTKLKPTPRSSE